jgi:hypothetical protein
LALDARVLGLAHAGVLRDEAQPRAAAHARVELGEDAVHLFIGLALFTRGILQSRHLMTGKHHFMTANIHVTNLTPGSDNPGRAYGNKHQLVTVVWSM